MASSEEWGDHLQSGLDSTSESSGTEPELSTQEVPEPESEIEVPAIPVPHSVSSSTAHAINLLHPVCILHSMRLLIRELFSHEETCTPLSQI